MAELSLARETPKSKWHLVRSGNKHSHCGRLVFVGVWEQIEPLDSPEVDESKICGFCKPLMGIKTVTDAGRQALGEGEGNG